jgi:hypothetical protein
MIITCTVLVYGVQCYFQQYFSYMYIVVVSFIGGRNWSTPRKPFHRPVACHRQTLSHNVVSSTPRHERGSNSQF